MTMSQITIARTIAHIAHRGQEDKGGLPYIEHPERVVGYLSFSGRHSAWLRDTATAVAWLHDVLEDTDITATDLRNAGVSNDVIRNVELLTRLPRISPEDYYQEISENEIALIVKLADIKDNTDPKRLAVLNDPVIVRLTRKYAKALSLLEA